MTSTSPEVGSSGKITNPAFVCAVVIGTYCTVLALLLSLYHLFNVTTLSDARYRADPAFSMSVFASVLIARGVVSPDFKQTWLFVCCWLAGMVMSCVSVLLHRAVPDFIEWYTGPLWTGLWGGFALTIVYVQRGRSNQHPGVADTKTPNKAVNPSGESGDS